MFNLGEKTTKHIALCWFQVHTVSGTAQKTNYKGAQKTHDSVACEAADESGKDG